MIEKVTKIQKKMKLKRFVFIFCRNWANEPNNAGGNENCAAMYVGGRYNDLPCDAKSYFICEKPVRKYYIQNYI